ncbi:hypothetical protein [Mucilaginibacter gossypiicola]|uniref:hypothetical protein n=1 Tax=Mucilaginibacter gossypiicola TaxID=551995 RepID=UPI000B82CF60|nr:hypothetical protein [Mucilaginibacter gossypiicola]
MKQKNFPASLAGVFGMLLLALWTGTKWLHRGQLPAGLKELLGISFIIWFAMILLRRNSDDDWAGQM